MLKYFFLIVCGIILFTILNTKDGFSIGIPGNEDEPCNDTDTPEDKCEGSLACIDDICINPCKGYRIDRVCKNKQCDNAKDIISFDKINDDMGVCLGNECFNYDSILSDGDRLEDNRDNTYTYVHPTTREKVILPKRIDSLSICGLEGQLDGQCRTDKSNECDDELYCDAEYSLCLKEGGVDGQCRSDPSDKCDDGLICVTHEGNEYCRDNRNRIGNENQICSLEEPKCNNTDLYCMNFTKSPNICMKAGNLNEPCRVESENKCNDRLSCVRSRDLIYTLGHICKPTVDASGRVVSGSGGVCAFDDPVCNDGLFCMAHGIGNDDNTFGQYMARGDICTEVGREGQFCRLNYPTSDEPRCDPGFKCNRRMEWEDVENLPLDERPVCIQENWLDKLGNMCASRPANL